MKKLKIFFLCIAITLMAVPSTFAADVYYSEAAFLGHIAPGYYLEDFTGWTYGNPYGYPVTTSASFGPVNGYSWNASAPLGIWSNVSALSTYNSLDLLTITFTGNPVTAVGGIFASTDNSGNPITENITVALSDGTSVTISGSGFLGFTSLVPILYLTADGIDSPSYNWPQVDHFYVGSNEAVPEPATMLLLGTGLAGLAGIRRKMRK